ncbi:MAG: bifunctional DNA-binding transcriptional regulator/O6-methylguanine-DNA methyltransferase Ada [Acidimicrobiales bacterium]
MDLTTHTSANSDEERWRAVLERSREYDGTFLFAVRTTGIYCRPSCPARRPRRENVQFFDTLQTAREAGYRACRRCSPDSSDSGTSQWVLTLCRRLEQPGRVPTLLELATLVGFSPSYVQRTFAREMGISPHQYGKARRLERLRTELRSGANVTSAVFDAGFNSNSVAYVQAKPGLGMTPRRWRDGGRGEVIVYTILDSDLGQLLVAATKTGLVAVRIGEEAQMIDGVRSEFPLAEFRRDDALLAPESRTVLAATRGIANVQSIPLDIAATAFQARVWSALQVIPLGETRSYAEVAAMIGEPRAIRAVAKACASNPVALVVPCHRVVRSDGALAGYRWGLETKEALLEVEGARPHQHADL